MRFRAEWIIAAGNAIDGKANLHCSLPGGRGILKAARPGGTINDFVGLLAGRTRKVAIIEEINAAAAQAWAGKE